MPIYTRKGDDGTTALFGGKRLSKSDPLIEAYGSIDELTSFLGLIIIKLKNKTDRVFFVSVQKDLYQIMAFLAGSPSLKINIKERVKVFEQKIDEYQARLPKLVRFILPGGSELSALFHIARTVCRRSERKTVAALNKEKGLEIVRYLNRLSDLLFATARFYNQGKETVL